MSMENDTLTHILILVHILIDSNNTNMTNENKVSKRIIIEGNILRKCILLTEAYCSKFSYIL